MGKTIEQIRIRKTSAGIRAESSRSRFGPDPLITIPARGFWKCRTLRPDRSSHSITCPNGQKLLAQRAATTEVPAVHQRQAILTIIFAAANVDRHRAAVILRPGDRIDVIGVAIILLEKAAVVLKADRPERFNRHIRRDLNLVFAHWQA
jgi:hypothetical protein